MILKTTRCQQHRSQFIHHQLFWLMKTRQLTTPVAINRTAINRSLLALALAVACLPAAFTIASAQTELTAGLRGVVTAKSDGAAIAGARVSVKNEALRVQREVVVNAEGGFVVPGLPPGAGYEISVSADGFRRMTRAPLALTAGDTLTLTLSLELGPVTETVTITDTALPVVSDRPEISQAVDARRLTELPSNGRSVNRFALLDPHVRHTAGLGSDGSSAARLSINANSFRHTQYKLDGTNNYDFIFANAPQQQVSLAAVQEFKVLTNQFSAEYGGTTAGIISATLKAGTDKFHGEGFYFLRPGGLQAAPPVSTSHVPNELHQVGGAFSGPLSKQTTFFTSYEHTRQDRGAFIQSPAPQVFTGHFRDHLALARVDHQINERHSLTARINGNDSTNDNSNDRIGGFTQPSATNISSTQSLGGQIAERMVMGSAINEARFSYVNSVPSNSYPLNAAVSIVRPNYSTEGGSSFSSVRTQTWQLSDQVTWQRGAHELKFGGDDTRQKARDFSFTPFGTYTFAPGPPTSGEQPLQYTQTFGASNLRYGQTLASFFAQDNWRVTPRLTANLGLRYDHQSITSDRNNFAPRLGLAWDVAGNGKTVVRAGAGVYYDQYYMYISRRFFTMRGFSPTASYKLDPKKDAAVFPAFPNSLTSPPASGVTARDLYLPGDKLLNPYSLQFSLGVQRELFGGWTLTLDGIHSHTVKQMRARDANAPSLFVRTAPGQARSIKDADATRPFTTFEGVPVKIITAVENSSSSLYDALDLGLIKRFAKRYQVEAHYIYSAAFTYAMFFGEPNTGVPQDWGTPDRADYGPSDFHQRHRFVAHGLVETPLQTQLSFVATLASGLPVNPLTGVDNNGDGNLVDRPVGFGRNSFRAPMQASFDLSLAKRFALREGVRLEARAETFNLFNRSNLIKVNSTYGNGATPLPTFLTPVAGVSNADPGRQFQLALRLVF